ncbi:ChaN family lipoprotein [Persephonella sp. KM09-Lau-8]|uniref:ChaN family lipoprotein n=1 Tax=Persephonella sp. KM09-Lau-8 TaxID=1158345 RepID=UPI000497B700|nr:ChaN family lipoprotein [Persephonella sp. KM09-Lau-8]
MKKFLILFFLIFNISYAQVFYKLEAQILPEKNLLTGKAVIYSDRLEEIRIYLEGLNISSIYYQNKNLSPEDQLKLKISPQNKVEINYSKKFLDFNSGNIITDEFISLIDNWYPYVDKLAIYKLSVEVPQGFILVSEFEKVSTEKTEKNKKYQFEFPYPTEAIHLIGSTKYQIKRKEFEGLTIEAYFFKKDSDFAEKYINSAYRYIQDYSQLVGNYPYKRFAIVENAFPTGYSMPTFTLIGQQIIKFPFIVEKSLAHEILHQWFGCSVYIKGGNWAEGLTTYLSDYRLSKDKKSYRKNVLLKYLAYAKDDYPLSKFYGKTDLKSEAIGYGKSMFFFHMLKNEVGEENFKKALSLFYSSFKFSQASWEDLKTVFQQISDKNLDYFFKQFVYKKGMPDFQIKFKDLIMKDDGFHISFEISQKQPYRLKIPITVETYLGDERFTVNLTKTKEKFEIVTKNEPLKMFIDRDYNLFRNLKWEEINPVLYFVNGSIKPIIYIPENEVKYAPIVKRFPEAVLKYPKEFSYKDIQEKNVFIMSGNNPVATKILGKRYNAEKTYVELFKNPFGKSNVIAVFNVKTVEEAKILARKMIHYGKYSKLVLEEGRVLNKTVKNTIDGIRLKLREEAEIVSEKGIKDFQDLIDDALKKSIIYLGEQHTLFSNHAFQLSVIKAIHKKYPDIAVGMEMFQRSKQPIIDQFINGEISEKEFLKKSGYFVSWKYNYHLYRPILLYCRKHKIPVIALNIDNSIIKKVSSKGITALSPNEKKLLPDDMNFADFRYTAFLRKIFSQHKSMDKKRFYNFIQSQIIWDETMAQTISNYIKNNPYRKIIVLAGSGHIRFRYGIPSRVERRTGKKGLTVVIDDQLKKNIADYIVYTAQLKGEKEKKLGVLVEPAVKGLKVIGVAKKAVAKKAGIKKGDIITEFNGVPVENLSQLKTEIFFSGKEATITVLRNGKKVELKLNF